jgi:acetyl/propionyl-CoA carboxylase alpha subunit
MTAAAQAAAIAVGYTNAGTIEFLVDPGSREFYFLEMNTRLQVEHPITELTTGLDIVEWQLRIAMGEGLPSEQSGIKQQGHAIECRIYAEDPANGFLPQAGQVLRLDWPSGEEIRVDESIGEGAQVSTHYDPLMAKLSVHAANRKEAIAKMHAALAQTALLGMTNNLEFLQAVLSDADVQAGNYDTAFIERRFAAWQPEQEVPIEALLAAAVLEIPEEPAIQAGEEDSDIHSPWASGNSFRIGERR